jgi:phage repressor protein C with HTH and peptisase S24 domain
MDLDPVRLTVLRLIEERGSDLKNASLAIGRNAAYLHQFVVRGTPKVLGEDDRAALAEYLGCEEDELRHHEKPTRKPRARADAAALRDRNAPEGYLAVPELDLRAAAGAGALHDGLEETKDVWYFPDPMVRHEFRAQHQDLRIITVQGDSMEPLLASGDRIMIDTSQRVPVPPGIFVIWDGMGLVAKRVEHAPHSEPPTVIIRSVNPEYATYQRDAEEVHVVGRVIWAAKRF